MRHGVSATLVAIFSQKGSNARGRLQKKVTIQGLFRLYEPATPLFDQTLGPLPEIEKRGAMMNVRFGSEAVFVAHWTEGRLGAKSRHMTSYTSADGCCVLEV